MTPTISRVNFHRGGTSLTYARPDGTYGSMDFTGSYLVTVEVERAEDQRPHGYRQMLVTFVHGPHTGWTTSLPEHRLTIEERTALDMTPEQAAGQLGWIVTWKVPPHITMAELSACLKDEGFDAKIIGELANEHAMRRALGEMSKNRVIRKLRSTGSKVYFQLTAEDITDQQATYTREAEVWLDRQTCEIGGDNDAIVDTAKGLLAKQMNQRVTSDLTRMVQRLFDQAKADLVPIREEGFAYFVPAQHSQLVMRIGGLLRAIGGRLSTFAVKIGSRDTDATVAESMSEYMMGLIREFRESCSELNTETRMDVRQRRIKAIGDMKAKLGCYQGLLQHMSGKIDLEIAEAEADMLRALATPAPQEAEPAGVA